MNKLRIFFIVFFGIHFTSLSQQVTIFNDSYGKQGEIRQTDSYVDSILPKNGKYEIRWREIDSTKLRTYLVKGTTKNHLPVGKWVWEQAEWNYTVSPGNTIRPVFQTAGQRMKWEGSFNEGSAEGKWVFKLDSINGDGVTSRSLLSIEMQLSKGKPTGSILMEDKFSTQRYMLKGNCDVNGVARGSWNYEYINEQNEQVKEVHVYNSGLLTEVQTTIGGQQYIHLLERNVEFLNNKKRYDQTGEIRIGDARFEVDEYKGLASELLTLFLNDYYLKGWALPIFPFDVMRDVPVFRQLEYPISESESMQIVACKNLIVSQKELISKHLTGNMLIHRSRSPELDVTISFLQLMNKRLDLIDSLLYRTESPLFTYKNRYEQGVLHWIKAINSDSVAVAEVHDSVELHLPLIRFNGDTLAIFKEINLLLVAHQVVLNQQIEVTQEAEMLLKREGNLKQLEDLMVENYQNLQSKIEHSEGIASEIYSKWMKNKAQLKLQEYAQTDDYESAMLLGNKFLVLMDSISSWSLKATEFDSMLVRLGAQYTYLAYNPYTGDNDIEIKVKKRFFSNVTTNLWPYMIHQLESEKDDWMKWGELYNRQFDVFNYLMLFATREDKQAKRLNKRLRKEKKPERMLKTILNQLDGSSDISFLNRN